MGILIGNQVLRDLKLGNIDVHSVYLGNFLVWPLPNPDEGDDINLEDLLIALSCTSLGIWIDVLPWSDNLTWKD